MSTKRKLKFKSITVENEKMYQWECPKCKELNFIPELPKNSVECLPCEKIFNIKKI